jgi:hypothetical protein
MVIQGYDNNRYSKCMEQMSNRAKQQYHMSKGTSETLTAIHPTYKQSKQDVN